MSIRVVQALSEADRALGRAVRHEVFVQEQSVPPELELDGLDEECQHFLALSLVGSEPSSTPPEAASTAIATARARTTKRGWKIERVAVVRAQRGRSVGAALVRHILARAPHGVSVYVHAQESALGFWQRMGFLAEGPSFDEAGISHRVMVWSDSTRATG